MDPGQDWIDALRDFICKLYEAWDGDCSELGIDATAWIDTLQGVYDENGAPTFQDEQARQSFLDDIAATETHLENSGNSLSQADNTQLRTLLTNLKNDVQGQGGA